MTHTLKPITITPEQIIAATQKIVDADAKNGFAHEYTADEYLTSVHGFVESRIHELLYEITWFAGQENFTVGRNYHAPVLDEAAELIMPPVPEWANVEPSIQ